LLLHNVFASSAILIGSIEPVSITDNMKTIAITIDRPMLERLDRLVAMESVPWKSRSGLIRHAVDELLARLERAAEEEERERNIVRRHRARLNCQAATLVKGQAKQ
jgi:metal-responsive CopG/Arc/MetJ family transcriptional regulator